MAAIYLKKHVDDAGTEYISASDIFETMDEMDDKTQQIFQFLDLVERMLNYFVYNSSTAFGNPDLALAEGRVNGYCMAKGWTWTEKDGIICVKKGYRTLFLIEKPAIPEHERSNRRDIRETLDELGV